MDALIVSISLQMCALVIL